MPLEQPLSPGYFAGCHRVGRVEASGRRSAWDGQLRNHLDDPATVAQRRGLRHGELFAASHRRKRQDAKTRRGSRSHRTIAVKNAEAQRRRGIALRAITSIGPSCGGEHPCPPHPLNRVRVRVRISIRFRSRFRVRIRARARWQRQHRRTGTETAAGDNDRFPRQRSASGTGTGSGSIPIGRLEACLTIPCDGFVCDVFVSLCLGGCDDAMTQRPSLSIDHPHPVNPRSSDTSNRCAAGRLNPPARRDAHGPPRGLPSRPR
jgi:hypothetical protein